MRSVIETADTKERTILSTKPGMDERGYELLFAQHPHPMWVYDEETLRFLDVNDAATAKYGYSR